MDTPTELGKELLKQNQSLQFLQHLPYLEATEETEAEAEESKTPVRDCYRYLESRTQFSSIFHELKVHLLVDPFQ